MGEKNRSGVRAVQRRGKKILVIDFRYRDKDGREQRCRRDASVQTWTAARAEAERLKRHAVEYGTVDATPAAPTFEEFVRDHFVPLAMPAYTPATRERYGRLLWKEGVIAALGTHRVNELGAREFRQLDAAVRGRGVNPRQHLIMMRVVLKLAVELGAIDRMPVLPAVRRQPRRLPGAPPLSVVARCIRGAHGWLRTAIVLAYFGTQRSGEARAIRVKDIDFEANDVKIRHAFSHTELSTTKGKDERPVPMAALLREVLEQAVQGKQPDDFIVVDETGGPPSRQKLYKTFVALQSRLGVAPTWSFHSLRHAFGTHAVRAGANVVAVRDLMGHGDLETTAGYLHAAAADKVAVIDALSGQLADNADTSSSLTH
ncbi:MAG TPA: tyrosine-type recombinase/integrase [Polyangiaceae bacterium]|nr:tyrosine-type recombinase/integrase [Polyangiaceae bacterium]